MGNLFYEVTREPGRTVPCTSICLIPKPSRAENPAFWHWNCPPLDAVTPNPSCEASGGAIVPPPVALLLEITMEPVATKPPTVTEDGKGDGKPGPTVRNRVPTPGPPGVEVTLNGRTNVIWDPSVSTTWILAVPEKVAELGEEASAGEANERARTDAKKRPAKMLFF